ncbi:hypothetical protein B0T19DRAFT_428083 [Cercophora scortea]|uniref:Uncharacterized protein n=1 Tax=Cercophora scortea TaxID=314031 RepID=A0AAE0IFZ8_9PEZI|nr:hypothetical protein B0T19DRAFT_428083 [Cercophora scortea]
MPHSFPFANPGTRAVVFILLLVDPYGTYGALVSHQMDKWRLRCAVPDVWGFVQGSSDGQTFGGISSSRHTRVCHLGHWGQELMITDQKIAPMNGTSIPYLHLSPVPSH